MEPRLSERLRGIIGGHGATAPRVVNDTNAARTAVHDLAALGGEWRDNCFVVERSRSAASPHGREAVGVLAERLQQASADAPMLAAGAPARPPFVFFDLETTGLSGGAGTYAFLVGCGWFDDRAFVTRQFLLTRFSDERALLASVRAELARAGALVSFNGKSFDAPLLETRYLFHRLEWIGACLPHVDVLHPARRFWSTPSPSQIAGGCSLGALEQQILAARRSGDIPGFEIPERYFRFVRSGDARPLAAVLEHNRLDLLSLAGLTARLLELVRSGPACARSAREALALGHVYTRSGFETRARDAYTHAIAASRAPAGAFDAVKVDALRALALAWRRARQYEDAATCWQQLLDVRGCPPHIAREATEALAIHHEHRKRDLTAAKLFALRSLEAGTDAARTDAARHRLARLDRKIALSAPLSSFLS
jgi:uncharacterized protein YprB with RNaseH-like and TPR domain